MLVQGCLQTLFAILVWLFWLFNHESRNFCLFSEETVSWRARTAVLYNYCNFCNACANCHNNYTIVQNYVQAVRYNWHNKNLGSPSYRSMEIYLLNQCLKFCLCCQLMKWCWWRMASLANWLLTNLSLDIKVLSWRRFQKINKQDGGGAPLELKELFN